MKKLLITLLGIFCYITLVKATDLPTIIPYPNHVEIQDGEFQVKNTITVNANSDIDNEIQYFKKILSNEYSLHLKYGKNAQITFINKKKIDAEAYNINISAQKITVEYSTPSGCFYAIQTLRQMLTLRSNGHYSIKACEIKDNPQYAWRSFMLDEARHFKGKRFVKIMLDQMAYLKMNRFHWHLTDDQGWRIEIKKYPLLTNIGAWRDSTQVARVPKGTPAQYRPYPHGGYYTQDDITEIINYAKKLHITIIPEIEMPGHATAAVAAYPWLSASDAKKKVECSFGIFKSTYNIADKNVYNFLTDVLTEVINLFPSQIIHIGGDEVKYDEWLSNDKVKELIEKEKLNSPAALQVYFVNQISRFINSKGARMMGWNDIMGKNVHEWVTVENSQTELSPNTIIHFWKGDPALLKEAIEKGYDVVNSNHWDTYLDYTYTRLPLEKAYNFSPLPDGIKQEQQKHVLGSGCQMWSEYVPKVTDAYKQIFPRIAAYAEVGWTNKEQKDYKRFLIALEKTKRYWDSLGITYNE